MVGRGSFVLQAGSFMREMAVTRWHGGETGIGKSRFALEHTEVAPRNLRNAWETLWERELISDN